MTRAALKNCLDGERHRAHIGQGPRKEDAQGNFPAQTSFYGARRQRYTRQGPDADLFFPLPDHTMDPNLHQKQAINHLNKVLEYASFVAEDGQATVHLTPEDWQVVADALFKMDTPSEMIPDGIKKYRITNEYRTIQLDTDDCLIDVEMI